MAVIDAKLIFLQDKDTGAKVISDVLDLGKNGANLNPLYIDVKLTKGVTAGSVASVQVQSSTDEEFTAPIEEQTTFIKADADKQKRPCQLVQTFCPITPGARYVRLVVTGDTTAPAGGKLWAYISPDIQVPI